jgi:hypothetical protein
MLEVALWWYKTFRKDLEDFGFIFNPYYPCVANKKVQGLQQTILFHVDDLKSSHKIKLVNDQFKKWLNIASAATTGRLLQHVVKVMTSLEWSWTTASKEN